MLSGTGLSAKIDAESSSNKAFLQLTLFLYVASKSLEYNNSNYVTFTIEVVKIKWSHNYRFECLITFVFYFAVGKMEIA